jgi:hypothetical protein
MSRRVLAAGAVEPLESRVLLATSPQISFTDFASTSGLAGNGFGAAAINAGSALRLTDSQFFQERSVWSDTRVPIDKFTTHFSFRSDQAADSADGLTFTVQNGPTSALGLEGNNLGYTGINNSVGVAFNIYNFHAFGSKFGFVQDGAFPVTETDMSQVGSNDPTITAAASATPVTGKFTNLSVSATDPGGEANLTYTWTTLRKPPGAKDVIFSDNGTNAAKEITGRFSKDGTFQFRVTVTNQSGGSVTSDVSVVVQQTGSDLRITPHKQEVKRGATLDFRAVVLDQFNHAMRTQPPVTFGMQSGPGTIDPISGLFTASSTRNGHFVVEASTINDLSGVSANVVT